MSDIHQHQVVSRQDWLAARRKLLAREKELTRLRDELNAERRALPWVKVDKEYTFSGTPASTRSCATGRPALKRPASRRGRS